MKIQFSLILILATFFCLGINACKKDPCETKNCQNGGICIDGDCDCQPGYIGSNCEILTDPCVQKQCVFSDTCLVNAQGEAFCICQSGYEGELCDRAWNAKYVGRFDITENCGPSIFYTVDIVSGPRFNEITIPNFHNAANGDLTAKVVAQAITPSVLNIPQQFMHFGEVNGFGGLSPADPNVFTLDYTIIDGTDTLECSAVFERQ